MHSYGVLLELILALELLRTESALELPVVTVTEHVQSQFVLSWKDLLALRTLKDFLRVKGLDVLSDGRKVVKGLGAF